MSARWSFESLTVQRRSRQLRSLIRSGWVAVRALVIVSTVQTVRLVGPGVGTLVADTVGRVSASLPAGRQELARQRRAFPHRTDQRALLASRAAISGHNRVTTARLLGARRDVARLPHREIRPAATEALLAGDRSFVVATGHFSSAMFLPFVERGRPREHALVLVGTSVHPEQPRWERWARGRSERVHNSGLTAHGATLVERGSPGSVRAAIKALRSPGHILFLFADADLSDLARPGVVRRPFAGRSDAVFGSGVAQLARLARVPIVVLVPDRDERGTVYEWSAPIEPNGRERDVVVTHWILDQLEKAVGRRPEQYALRVGGRRSWDPVTERWVGHDLDD